MSVVGQVVVGRWQWLAVLSVVLLAIYVVDAAIRYWRQRGSDATRRPVIVAGGAGFFRKMDEGEKIIQALEAIRLR